MVVMTVVVSTFRMLPQKAVCELDEPLVAFRLGLFADPANVLVQPPLAPVISGRLLGAGRLAGTCGLEQRRGSSRVERGIAAVRKRVIAVRDGSTCIFVDKRAGQIGLDQGARVRLKALQDRY